MSRLILDIISNHIDKVIKQKYEDVENLTANELYEKALKLYNEKDTEKFAESVYLLKMASKKGSDEATIKLGSVCAKGMGFVDFEEIKEPLKALAYNGNIKASLYLGIIYHKGFGRTERNFQKAIKWYMACLVDDVTEQNASIQALACSTLIQCYLELHYIEEANATRNEVYYRSSKKNKEEAKRYLAMFPSIVEKMDQKNRWIVENRVSFYASILNDNTEDLSQMSYGAFRKKYYGLHPNLFLTTKKSEDSIYRDGIKNYFRKRDESEEELEQEVVINERNISTRRATAVRAIGKLKFSTKGENVYPSIMSDITEVYAEDENEFESNYVLDYSNCVINLDKYLEEILHQIFVKDVVELKKQQLNNRINNSVGRIKELVDILYIDDLKIANNVINKIDLNIPEEKKSKESHLRSLRASIEKILRGPKSNQDKIDEMFNYLAQKISEATIDADDNSLESDMDMIAKNPLYELFFCILGASRLKMEYSSIEEPQKFELGSLFDMTFVEHDDEGKKTNGENSLQKDILDFAKNVNPKMSKEELTLRLSELILKVEHFRIMVRNVASHKSILTQKHIEQGIKICIMQDGSIFNLLDELFGEHIKKKAVRKDVQRAIKKANIELSEEEIDKAVEEAIKAELVF